MLTPCLRSQFVTKILNSSSGEKFQVVFLVALIDGEMKAQVVSATPLSNPEMICLPSGSIKSSAVFTYTPKSYSIVSPFYSLLFFNSQPTRAPAFVK